MEGLKIQIAIVMVFSSQLHLQKFWLWNCVYSFVIFYVCCMFSFGKIFLDSWLFYCPVLTTLYSMFSTSRKGVLSASMCALLTQPSAFNQGACPILPSFLATHWSLVLGRGESKIVCWDQKQRRRTESQFLGRNSNETARDIMDIIS